MAIPAAAEEVVERFVAVAGDADYSVRRGLSQRMQVELDFYRIVFDQEDVDDVWQQGAVEDAAGHERTVRGPNVR